MLIKNLNPYILLNGGAEKAIRLYEAALGAKVEALMRYGDGPPCDPSLAIDRNLVMHACLTIGSRTLMISDAMPGQPAKIGNQVSITADFADPKDMVNAFEALSVGGTVTMPIQDTFWGAKFGTLTDAFGVNWMFNCTLPKE
ncbi:MAG: VOC family protein [Acidobacteria bacterium]|nr:VOC family protein [Acidobacteriota bacterium]